MLKCLNRKFSIIVFDWDGTAVPSRKADVFPVLGPLETLLEAGIKLAIITGTNFDNINTQFCSKVNPGLKKRLFVCTNRGSEVYGFEKTGEIRLLFRRTAADHENKIMDRVSLETQSELKKSFNYDIGIIFNRLNRRKLDLIPIPEWSDPPKEKIDELLVAVENHLESAGITGGIHFVINRVKQKIKESGLDLRITTDVKHIELGLTDKSDSVKYIIAEIAQKDGIKEQEILFLGDEFGMIAGFEGSDYKMHMSSLSSTYISVGKEPNGVPKGIFHYGNGADGFRKTMEAIIENQVRKPAW